MRQLRELPNIEEQLFFEIDSHPLHARARDLNLFLELSLSSLRGESILLRGVAN